VPNISEYYKLFHALFVNCLNALADEVGNADWPEAQALQEKLYSLERSVIDKASEAFILAGDDGEFGVLCHGDLWLQNVSFHYDDDNQPIDVKLVRKFNELPLD